MVGGPMKLAVNEYIMANPDRALEATGVVLAAGIVAVTLRQIMQIVGVKDSDLPEGGMAEVDALDEQQPEGFFGSAVLYTHESLKARKMRGGGELPKVGWQHGLWRIRHASTWLGAPDLDDGSRPLDVVDVTTPVLDEDGVLR